MTLTMFPKAKTWAWLGLLLASVALGLLTALVPLAAIVLLVASAGLLSGLGISRFSFWVLLFLTAFMPFESFVLKFLPVSERIYFASQFVSELLVYLTFVGMLFRKMLKGASWRRTPVDLPLAGFITVALLSTIINRAPLSGSLINLRSLLRYVALFYLVVNMDLSKKRVEWLLRVILFVGVLQILIGGLQLASAGKINGFLMPRQTDLELLGKSRQFRLVTQGREQGSIFGTLGDTVYLAFFMLVVVAVYLGRLKKLNSGTFLFLAVTCVAIMYTFSRAAVFGMLFMLLIFYWLRYGMKRFFPLLLLLLPLAIAGLLLVASTFNQVDFVSPVKEKRSVTDNLTSFLSREYFEIAQKQRLGALTETLPTILVNKPILGYGFDEPTTIEHLNSAQPSFLTRPLSEKGFEDVYWVALLAYCGLVGVGFLALLLYRLLSWSHRIYTQGQKVTREVALTVLCVTSLVPFLLFFNQVLEFRIYSFYFWMLAALMFSMFTQEKKYKSRST